MKVWLNHDSSDLEWDFQNILAIQSLNAPNSNSQIQACRYKLVLSIYMSCQALDLMIHAFKFSDKFGVFTPFKDYQPSISRT